MDQVTPSKPRAKPSGLPRLSKLPLPSSIPTRTLRPSPSRERLEADQGLSISRLRATSPRQPILSNQPARRNEINNYDLYGTEQKYASSTNSGATTTENLIYNHRAAKEDNDKDEILNTDIAVSDEEFPISPAEAPIPRRSRLSLSERTIETLSNSPLAKDRKSSFYSNRSPTRQLTRFGSGSSRGVSNSSRQSSGSIVSSNPPSRTASSEQSRPGQYSYQKPLPSLPVGSALPRSKINSGPGSVDAKLQNAARFEGCARSNSRPSMPVSNSDKQCLVSRSTKTREPLRTRQPRQSTKESATIRQPILPARSLSNEKPKATTAPPSRPSTGRLGSSQPKKPLISKSTSSSKESDESNPELERRKVSNSSSALRETIAQAKAARRDLLARKTSASGQEMTQKTPGSSTTHATSFASDFGIDDYPSGALQDDHINYLKKRVNDARTDGRLNISAMGLKAIPSEVIHMYDLDSVQAASGSWYECVDLVRFIAADNEISEIEDHIFPDKRLGSAEYDDEDDQGNQFGGLEVLDLHGNLLNSIPPGLRRLERLVTLNLSNNHLSQGSLDIITGIKSLQVLKLANNKLEGDLESNICCLNNLEVLDLHGNSLTSLPDSMEYLTQLRILNVSQNKLRSIPVESLVQLPIKELTLSNNNLSGTLFGPGVTSWSSLQSLDISTNNINKFSEETEFHLPSLQTLALSLNSLRYLPDTSSWTELITLTMEDNKLSSIPPGFTSLPKIKSVDFTGNNIGSLDEHIGRMESLEVFRLAGNPLRERNFLNMSTEQLKGDLASRLDPDLANDHQDLLGSDMSAPSALDSSSTHPFSALAKYPVKTDGKFDLSSRKFAYNDLEAVPFEAIAAESAIRTLLLSHNKISHIPVPSLTHISHTLVSLNLSHNALAGSNIFSSSTAPLVLPKLKSLSLAFNSITSLSQLQSHLDAPQLDHLDISTNRITSLPVLRSTFPNLTTLIAPENAIQELPYEAVVGLTVLNLASNDVIALPPRLGLLKGSLKSLDVKGNRFRVPKYTVLDKGTDATLDWLRDRIPAEAVTGENVDD